MMKKVFVFVSVFVILISCDKMGESTVSKGYFKDEMAVQEAIEPSNDDTPLNPNEEDVDLEPQKLIKTGSLSFETQSLDKTYQIIAKNIKNYHGYVQNDFTQKSYDRISRDLTVRIPVKNFQPLVDSIATTVKVFDRKEINTKDVTEKFVDIEARIKAKRKLEERYLQLLSKAKTMGDMLEIERQVAQIREEIEAKQGRLKYLQNQVTYSTLHLSFYELIPVQNAPSKTYLSRLWRAAKSGFQSIGNFFIGLVYVWPFILIGVLIGLWIRNRIRKRKAMT